MRHNIARLTAAWTVLPSIALAFFFGLAWPCTVRAGAPASASGFSDGQIVIPDANGLSDMTVADLDGDGDLDVLGSNIDIGEVFWFENLDGLGTFGPKLLITDTADGAAGTCAADLDGDGDLDVLVASIHDDTIAWYENTDGHGSFGPARVISSTFDGATDVIAVDVNGDHRPDVVARSILTGRIGWFQNTDGAGHFGGSQVFADGREYALQDIVAADVDGDGDMDILSSYYTTVTEHGVDYSEIAWYENQGGTFNVKHIVSNDAFQPRGIYCADIDGDGDNDVVSASWGDEYISWFENTDGAGTFGPLQVVATNVAGADEVVVADMDGDGDADIVSESFIDESISWHENLDGRGTFGPRLIIASNAGWNKEIAVVDFDGDGDKDVLSGRREKSDVVWYKNSPDCNHNGIVDGLDIQNGTSNDCDANGVPDECEPNADCNSNGLQDICDIANGTSDDCNFDRVPDECQPNTDCNHNSVRDICEIGTGAAVDCNGNSLPDTCDIASGTSEDCNANGRPDECERDCNGNGRPDDCDLADGTSFDCDGSGTIDECELDCNGNGLHDSCDLANGTSQDCNHNGIPDECDPQADCNNNGIQDICDVAAGSVGDCNHNEVPDECESQEDCNGNGIQDICDVAYGIYRDCNGNGRPDNCDLNDGISFDCDHNTVPDECDIADGSSADCNGNGVPDSCDIANGTSLDEDGDGIPDECCVPPTPPVYAGVVKNRYLSLASIDDSGIPAAIRITPISLPGFEGFEGTSLWVGPPARYPDEDASKQGNSFWASGLQCDPYYRDWSTMGVLDVFGAEILPLGTYIVQVIMPGCQTDFVTSAPLTVSTGQWGDMVPPYYADSHAQPDFRDVEAAVAKFLAQPSAPSKALAECTPNRVFPGRAIDFNGIAAVVESYLGTPYESKYSGPCTCPSAVTCGATACANDAACGSGYCIDGACTDACGRCSP